MSEERKQENKIEEKAAREAAEVKVEKTEENKKIEADLSEDKEEQKMEGVEDLPEEVKKKLAKTKVEKTRKKVKRKKRSEKRNVKVGRVYIKATYNNTIVTITDLNGDVISWASAGIAGFKGAKKATPYAAQIITRIAVTAARQDFGLEEVSVFIKGVGTGRESAVRALNANGLNITSIKDITPIPHNGCRPRKPRRV